MIKPDYITDILAGKDGRTEVKTDESTGNIIVFSGIPDRKDPRDADQYPWTISRSTISIDTTTGTTAVETLWARGKWADRESLTYNYL